MQSSNMPVLGRADSHMTHQSESEKNSSIHLRKDQGNWLSQIYDKMDRKNEELETQSSEDEIERVPIGLAKFKDDPEALRIEQDRLLNEYKLMRAANKIEERKAEAERKKPVYQLMNKK